MAPSSTGHGQLVFSSAPACNTSPTRLKTKIESAPPWTTNIKPCHGVFKGHSWPHSYFGFFIQQTSTYNENTCCNLALNESQFIGLIPENKICGQEYSKSLPAAEPLYVSYAFCSSRCNGIGLSDTGDPSQWASSIVQFILPSIIFSTRRPLTRWYWVNDAVQLIISLFCFIIMVIPVTIDTILWIIATIVGAGNMVVGGIYEAHLDYRVVKYINDMEETMDEEELSLILFADAQSVHLGVDVISLSEELITIVGQWPIVSQSLLSGLVAHMQQGRRQISKSKKSNSRTRKCSPPDLTPQLER
ncbi:uncharacterized protein PAC_16057 [Phialocephala subalpina]|uniref:Uncharacterized protein n=1 Tax=Phialocephala subalpina TaxID=576137 RepID=A0A1L7XMH8_9HELO|nr:uncharacterized protein PAC_16057 [Phialocephala subalpina]